MRGVVFRHSGKLGNIVYSLPAVSAFADVTSYVNADGVHLLPPAADLILPLLNAQPYIQAASAYAGEPFDHDFDLFRRFNVCFLNLADCHLMTLNLPPRLLQRRWLQTERVETVGGNGVLLARSSTAPGSPGVVEELYRAYGSGAAFVGTEPEWTAFVTEVGLIEFAPTRDLLHLAEIIAGCRLFIGNRSCPLAIAEGLKVPIMHIVYPQTPNSIFYWGKELSDLGANPGSRGREGL
jgi:hypothetical protein